MIIEEVANIREILQFIHDAHFIQPWELANAFGYKQRGAETRIYRLHKARLIDNPIYGKWNLTTAGERRLEYYGRKDKEKTGIREHSTQGVITT